MNHRLIFPKRPVGRVTHRRADNSRTALVRAMRCASLIWLLLCSCLVAQTPEQRGNGATPPPAAATPELATESASQPDARTQNAEDGPSDSGNTVAGESGGDAEGDAEQNEPDESSLVLPNASAEVAELVSRARKAVVVISFLGRDGREAGLGSGVIIEPDGLIATNLHVIGEARPIKVKLDDGRSFDVTSIHATERALDLALIRIDAKDLPSLPLGDSNQLQQGQPVIAIGNPLGLRHSVVSGIVSERREVAGMPMIQLAMPIEPGNSGGPLLDLRGRIHGLLTLKSRVKDDLGYAVEINALKPLIDAPNPIPIEAWLTVGKLDPSRWETLGGANWRQRAGRLTVSGYGDGFGGRSLCLSARDAPDVPFELAVRVKLEDESGAAGLVFHADGDDKHYGFYPTNGQLRLARFDGPTVYSWNVLQTVDSEHYRSGEWNTLKVRVDSDGIHCLVNDELVIESRDGQYVRGRVGLAKFRDTRAEFRGFAVGTSLPPSRPQPETIAGVRKLIADMATDRPPATTLAEQVLETGDRAEQVLREEARQLQQKAARLRELATAVQVKRAQDALVTELDKPEADIDLLRAALLLAQMDNPDVNVEAYVAEADRLAEVLKKRLEERSEPASEQERLEALNAYLFEELGFHGSRTNYYHRSNSYVNEAIDDREGLPITLSVLYMELARRLDLRVVGVGLPGHFVVRFEPTEGDGQLIDVFDRGTPLSHEDAVLQVVQATGRPLEDRDLAAQTPRAIVVRMLNNLRNVALEEKDAETVLRYVETLNRLEPDDLQYRMSRALLEYETGRHREALENVQQILEEKPEGINIRELQRFRDHLRSLQD